jgi:hypothetical protein
MRISKVMSLVLAVTLALSGPVTALAQSRGSGAAPAMPAETPQAAEADKSEAGETAYRVGAGVATVINIPMRGALCIMGGGFGLAVLVITFGSGYRAAARVAEEGCGGPWVITAEHLKGTER